MARKVKFKERDRGWKAVVAEIGRHRGNPRVKVGLLASSGEHKGGDGGDALTVVDVGTFHEFGTTRIPQRSFIRATVDIKRQEIGGLMTKLAGQIVIGAGKVRDSLRLVGVAVQGMIRGRITDGIEPPLAPSTIDRKNARQGGGGESTPLIDTGQLRNSVNFEVVDK